VVVPSRATADEVIRFSGISAGRIEIVPYAPQDQIAPASRAAVAATLGQFGLPERGYVLSVGTIEPRKNHERLVEAFERAVDGGLLPRDAALVIAGQPGWRHEAIIERIRSSRHAARIRLLGYVASGDLAGLYGGCAVAAYVSLYEGFGLPVVEAMAHGAATVTSSVSSMPEVAGDAGYLADPRSVASIAEALGDAWADTAAGRDAVAERARNRAATFTWGRAAATIEDLYLDCAARRPA
jgi:alpha-1,3-rhamnosyl/mannosyltransferase